MAQLKTFKKLAGFAFGLGASLVAIPVFATETSLGENGINALRLHEAPYNLIGRKIAIGQIEIGRPGLFGLDKAVARNPAIAPFKVFFRNTIAKNNANVDLHAQQVAGVMISSDKAYPGVAPGARLHSAAIGTLRRSGQPEECLSAQHLAQQNGGDLRAINFSFGESLRQDPRPNALLDGNALLTQCIDWSARVHNVLYVIAGNQGKGGISIPTDNYNGINVAFTRLENGSFSKTDFANLGDPAAGTPGRIAGYESNVGPRRSIGLVAPGSKISLVNLDGTIGRASGTSFAAPHVTATVALLQEYGDGEIQRSLSSVPNTTLPNWTLDARRHEVMKAVMFNSADKLKDRGNGLNLGMTRDIFDQSHRTWLASEAFYDRKIPLDIQLGAGQLNAYRAYQQFSAGQWQPGSAIPAKGWDYNRVSVGDRPYQDYILERPLQAGSMLSATLVWNRHVELNDANQNDEYDLGETFTDRGLNNLDLYLMPADSNNIQDNIWSSVSEVDSTEHIFQRIPETGRYKIRVYFRQQANEPTQDYAIAWWSVPVQ
ncbi:MAG: S8 family serine peptidase [Desertifilum sp.]|nr:S8 family serine peptidase [Desertifilum sp.]